MLAKFTTKAANRKRSSAMLRLWVILCVLMNAVQQPSVVRATDDVANISPCELESIINQLVNPSAEYQLHASALRNQLKNLLRDRQLPVGEEQSLNDYDYPEEDKRSVASLASLGYLRAAAPKRSLGILAKNGQLPTPADPIDEQETQKRYIGALARSGGLMSYGKRNIGTLARDFQLPQNGKRNLATLARMGLINGQNREPKRNLAAVARYNSNRMNGGSTAASSAAAEKRNLGALKGSPVHGMHQKREDEDAAVGAGGVDVDYDLDLLPGYWLYPSYADLDWSAMHEQQKRFLDTSKDPELFGINNGHLASIFETVPPEVNDEENNDHDNDIVVDNDDTNAQQQPEQLYQQQKRHIGSIARSGFLPSYRALRSTYGSSFGGGGGMGGNMRFSRSGRARQFVEYFPQRERLRQPIAAVCKRCFQPFRPALTSWGGAGIGTRGFRTPRPNFHHSEESHMSNTLPMYDRRPFSSAARTTWGTPPRITALHRRSFRRPNTIESYQY